MERATERNCRDCFNFRVRLTVRPNGRIVYTDSPAQCRMGELLDERNNVKTFRDILRCNNDLKTFRHATRCPWYEGEDGE